MLACVAVFLGCSPPLNVTTRDRCAVVSVQRWGEYYTVIIEVTLRKANDGSLVWRATALPNRKPRLHFVKLCAGTNAAAPEIWGDSDSYRYEVAGGKTSFELQPGVSYVIEVRGSRFLRSSHQLFTL